MPKVSSKRRKADPGEVHERCHWTTRDETALVEFLVEYRREANGDIHTVFSKATWTAAEERMRLWRTSKGGPKTALACKNKYAKLGQTYAVVEAVSQLPGVKWDDEHGANVGDDRAAVSAWNAYVSNHPKAAPFRNTGWPFFQQMQMLRSPEAFASEAHEASDTGTWSEEEETECTSAAVITELKQLLFEIRRVCAVVPPRRPVQSPLREAAVQSLAVEQALMRARELETDLDSLSLATLLSYLTTHPDAAGIYNLLVREDVRHVWVQNAIRKMSSS